MKAWTLSNAAAGQHREEVARFWIHAPEDALEMLWDSVFGEATRLLITQLTSSTAFSTGQLELRDELFAVMRQGFNQPGSVKVMIAAFLLSPPGTLTISNAETKMPAWLLPTYRQTYQIQHPAAAPVPTQSTPSTLQEFAANRIQLNRLLGLSNLYYIDPEDQEIRQDLQDLRLLLCQLILNCPPQDLDSLIQPDLADRYWALVRSGIQTEPTMPDEKTIKDVAFSQPQDTRSLLVALCYQQPNPSILDQVPIDVPGWLLSGCLELMGQTQITA
jgi:hypothetical protein